MREITYLKAINEAVDEEMARDPLVILMGQDVRKWGAPLGEFKGLYEKYGERVLDTGISETAMLGATAGSAATGMRPIVHIMFGEFLGVCMSDIRCALTKTRYMTGGKTRFPATIMTYTGAGRSAAGEHSACPYGVLMATPGLKIVAPSTPYDAKGLIKSAIREDNPVQVFYHVGLIFSKMTSQIPDEEYTVSIGEADIKREGSDVTVVAIGLMVHRAIAAANRLQEKGISLEVVDPRSLAPLDKQTIIKSVEKTGRLVIMDEEPKTESAASEIAAIVAEEAFDLLDAPIKRVCAPDTPIPFSPALERAWMPDEEDLIRAVVELTG
ncbi:MAG TPA: alpha-ketoacid dehydrogenase subunit beta [Dehalococcoidia bacterium]|nr:alpha-ketoacid dehydrogenase subunit beta [Dehalococcoidia bacterium]